MCKAATSSASSDRPETPAPPAWRRWARRIGLGVGATLALLIVTGGFLVWCLNYWPDPVERAPVRCNKDVVRLAVGERFRLLSWNLQYAAGKSYHFFYDGGPDVHASREAVERTLGQIKTVLAESRADILVLQEVDRDSARTARIDQLERLRSGGAWSCWTSAPYHKTRYLPFPLKNPLGRIDFHLATAARYRLLWARRRALPQLKENVIRRAFNLKRAILESALSVEGSAQPLVLLNTHLSAFSKGDGTLDRQVSVILKRLAALDAAGTPWILAGDFNMLPPGDDPKRLGAEAKFYSDKRSPIERLMKRWRTAIPAVVYAKDPQRYNTYVPPKATQADRRLDYIFVSRAVQVHAATVVQPPTPISDHLPLLITASIRP